MKKLFSVLLALIFFSQALPVNVIAESINPLPTSQELSAAVALTGLLEDAPIYRSGMEPSENMNAMQLAGWIHEFQKQKLSYIMDTFENYDVELAYVKEKYPTTFSMLKGYSAAGIGRLYDEYSEAKAWRDDVYYYDSLLVNTAARINVLADYLKSGEISEREQVIYAYEIRDKWRTLERLIPEIADRAQLWTQEYDRLETLLTGPYEFSGSDESLAWLLDEVDNLRTMNGRKASTSFSVSAKNVRVAPDQTLLTRIARLAPISSALADSDQKMIIKILDDKSFGITLVDGTARVSGGTVYVGENGKAEHKDVSDESGGVLFPVREFQSDSDGESQVNLRVDAKGYRRIEAPGIWVMKGKALNVPMKKDDGKPYLVSWSFWGHDMQLSKYAVITSPLNDTKLPIVLKVSSSSDYHLKVYFVDKEGKNTEPVGEGDGGKGEKTFTFEGQWLMKAPVEGKLYAEITSGGTTETYEAQLELKASLLKKPLGDPNTKTVLKPGFQITLPDGWVKPFGGMKINVDIPITDEVWQIRMFFDLNGSGAITVGTQLLTEPTKELTSNWKTKDQKALDKAVKDVKGQGYMAETKARNGGDWAGRKKYSPMKLGKVSLTISFFAFVQWQYTEDGYDYGRIFGKGGAGFTATLSGSYALMWPLAQLGVTLSATFTIFPEVGVLVDTYWPGHEGFPQFKKIEYVKGALNLIVRIDLCFEAVAGVKGVASISLRGIGYLEFALRSGGTFNLDAFIEDAKKGGQLDPSKYVDRKKEFTIYAGGSVDVILEIFWAKATYALLDPPLKWMLYPERKRISEVKPTNPVERFIASLLSSAQAAEEEGAEEGGAQVDTGNRDLLVASSVVNTWNDGTEKSEVFTMRPAGSENLEPMMLYIQKKFDFLSEQYNRPVLVGTSLNSIHYLPLICDNGLSGKAKDHFMPADGYDVIDFGYFVSDVSDAGLTAKDGKKINDVLFTACILAKEYETQRKLLDDGTWEERTVPSRTWGYVRCYYLSSDKVLQPLYLPGQNHYWAESIDFESYHPNNANGNPHVTGGIDRNSKGQLSCVVWMFTDPLNIQSNKYAYGLAYVHAFSPDAPEIGEATLCPYLYSYEDFFKNRKIGDLHFFRSVNAHNTIFYNGLGLTNAFFGLVQKEDAEDSIYDLAFKMEDNHDIRVLARNVVSFAPRGYDLATRYYHRAFFVQQTEDGEGYRLMGVVPLTTESSFRWNVRDYDIPMPPTDIYWTDLYGRECLYWMETAGETEDGKNSLFNIRGMWYDVSADSFSEPFVIATLKTPTVGSYPTMVYLADENEGFYSVKDEKGRDQLYRFNFKLVPGIKLVGNVLTETLPQPGSYDDMLLTVLNNGNVPITGLDLNVYHEYNGKAAEVFETIHLDILHPNNNSVVLQKGLEGAKENRQGQTVARQEPSSLSNSDEEYRYLKDVVYRTSPSQVLERSESLVKTNLLMPGKFTAFNISLLIPQTWEGNHHIYLEVDRYYTSAGNSFQQNVNEQKGGMLLMAAGNPGEEIISIGRDGTVRRERSGGMLLFSALGAQEETEEDFSMYKTDLTFDRIELENRAKDLSMEATRWNNNGEPMVTLTVTNWAHIGSSSRTANEVIMEAFLDEETTPVFRYSLPDEISDKETWNFDVPLSLLTDGRSASKVTIKISSRNYKEVGDVDNTVVLLLDTDNLSFLVQPNSQEVPAGYGVSFYAAAIGGRMPYKYQWQVKTPKGGWTDLEGENADTLILNTVTMEMSGNQYRLIVTDAAGYKVESSAATLTVKNVPHTGDTTPILWYILGIAAAAGAICFVVLKKKKENF